MQWSNMVSFSATRKWMALLPLLALLLAIYMIVRAAWWAPLSHIEAEITQLQLRESRAKALVGIGPSVQTRLAQARERDRHRPWLMAASSSEQAVAELTQLVDQQVNEFSPDGDHCAVVNRTPLPTKNEGPLLRASASFQLRCGNDELIRLIGALERGQPPFFIDQLQLSRSPIMSGEQNGVIDANLTVSGYLRVSGATPIGKKAGGRI